jgi:hypothetical protein
LLPKESGIDPALFLQPVALLTRKGTPPTQRGLEHDPEKACHAPRAGVATGFSRDQRENALVREDMLEQESERVAQAVEHVTFNHGVAGSSPAALTKLNQ